MKITPYKKNLYIVNLNSFTYQVQFNYRYTNNTLYQVSLVNNKSEITEFIRYSQNCTDPLNPIINFYKYYLNKSHYVSYKSENDMYSICYKSNKNINRHGESRIHRSKYDYDTSFYNNDVLIDDETFNNADSFSKQILSNDDFLFFDNINIDYYNRYLKLHEVGLICYKEITK